MELQLNMAPFKNTSITKLTLKNYIAISCKNKIARPFMFQKETKL